MSGNSRLPYKFVGISHEFIRQKGIPAHPWLQVDNSRTLWCQKGALKGNEHVAHSQCFQSTEAAEMKVSCRRITWGER